MKENKNEISLDLKDTAGYRLMQHEERIKQILNKSKERRNNNGREDTNTDAEHKN